jgi:hypothetical protein
MSIAKWFRDSSGRRPARCRRTLSRGVIEALETRKLLSNVTVNTVYGHTSPPIILLYAQSSSTSLAAPIAKSPGSTESPGPVLTTSTPTFTWQPVTGATGYQINIYDNTLKKFYSYKVGASATGFTIDSGVLTAGDSFVWNVRALSGSQSGPPSVYLNFQTPGTALAAPIITSPSSTESPGPVLTTLTPTFTWQSVSGATGYFINIHNLTTNTFYTHAISGGSTTSFTIPSGVLAAGDSYNWHLYAQRGSTTSPPSILLYFQTPGTVLAAPIAKSPGGTESPGPVLTTLTPTFTWQPVTGATGYQINIYDYTLKKFSSYKVGASATSFTIDSGVLTAGDSFVWNVRALSGSVTGPESVYLNFRT